MGFPYSFSTDKKNNLDKEAPVLTLKLPCLINQNHHSHDENLEKKVFLFA